MSLSVVDEQLDRFDRWPSPESRFVNIEQAWSVPFLLARVSAVVGPRWTTAPSADLVFYKAFYDAVRSDVPLGLAVSLARTSVRAAHPDRADWLAYTYFGHPACEPYPVETAEAFAMFEPLGVAAGESFVAGRTYTFRASYRSELPAWYRGRRRARTQRVDGDGVQVLVAPVSGGEPATYDLVPASGDARGTADDYYAIVTLTMPNGPSRYKVFVQFTRGEDELRSTVMALPVVRDEHALLAGTTVVAAPVTDVGAG